MHSVLLRFVIFFCQEAHVRRHMCVDGTCLAFGSLEPEKQGGRYFKLVFDYRRRHSFKFVFSSGFLCLKSNAPMNLASAPPPPICPEERVMEVLQELEFKGPEAGQRQGRDCGCRFCGRMYVSSFSSKGCSLNMLAVRVLYYSSIACCCTRFMQTFSRKLRTFWCGGAEPQRLRL